VHPQGVILSDAWISGELDFDSCTLSRPLWLQQCHIEKPPNFQHARTQIIGLSGSWVPSLEMNSLTTEGPVFLGDGFEAARTVNLGSAKIGGALVCDGGKFRGEETSLDADKLTTEGPVFLGDGFEAAGMVVLVSTKIGGQLDCSGGKFRGEETALMLEKARVEGDFLVKYHAFQWRSRSDRRTGRRCRA
jgi:hypothetical protein